MNSHFQAGDPGALLRERLEALVSQLAELEKLRERVGREESTSARAAQGGRSPSPFRTASGRSGFAEAKLVPALLGPNRSGVTSTAGRMK